MARLFGTDGVRGVAGDPPMTPSTVARLGLAAGRILREGSPECAPRVIVGRDTRISGDMIEAALVAGLTAAGVDVRLAGVLPTPAVSFLTRRHATLGGAMISASHNPYTDNGVKFFSRSGDKLPDAIEEEIEAMMARDPEGAGPPGKRTLGCVHPLASALSDYTQFAVDSFGMSCGLAGFRIVVDCAHGAASSTTPRVLRALGAEVFAIHDRPDGTNINDGCGSLHPEQVRRRVLETGAGLGITHDGDADRVLLVDETGGLLDGDAILGLLARDLKGRDQLPHDTVVATVMSNIGLSVALRALGVTVLRAPVGDRYVRERMDAGGYVLGGEPSGHVILSRIGPTGDGLMTALEVLKVLLGHGGTLSELNGFVPRFPQILLNVPVKEKLDLNSIPGLCDKVSEVEQTLGDEGRVVLRYSGTEPLARVMVEGRKRQQVLDLAESIASVIRTAIGVGGLEQPEDQGAPG